MISLNKLVNLCKKKLYKNYPLMCARIRIKRILALLASIFRDYKNRKVLVTKSYFLKRWYSLLAKFRAREAKLSISLKKISLKTYLVGANRLNDFFTFKKILRLCCLVKAKKFFEKIHAYTDFKNKINRFGQCLIKHEREVLQTTHVLVKDRINKIYTSVILNRFIMTYDDIENNKYIRRWKKAFLFTISHMFYGKSHNKYIFSHQQSYLTRGRRKMEFAAQALSDRVTSKEKGQDQDSNLQIRYPVLCFLADLFLKRKAWAYKNIKRKNNLYKLFNLLLKISLNQRDYKPFLEKMKKDYAYNKETPPKIRALMSLFRRYVYREFTKNAPAILKRVKARYLINLLLMHCDVVKYRYLNNYLRKWIVKISQQESVKAKMLSLYKNMQLQYLEMANHMFGKNEDGIFEQFNKISDKFDMYNCKLNSINEIKKKHTREVKYTYNFKKNINDQELVKKVKEDNEQNEANLNAPENDNILLNRLAKPGDSK